MINPLEFVTAKENLIHALDLGLNHRCEDKVNAKLTNNQVNNICKLLENNLSYNEIIISLKLGNIPNINKIIADIKRGKCYKTISKNYNIPNYKISSRKYSIDQINIICESIVNNPNLSNAELYLLANLPHSTISERKSSRGLINSIKSGKAYKNIFKNYICNSKRFND